MKKSLKMLSVSFLLFVFFNGCSDDNGLNFNTKIDNTDHAATANFTHYVGINSQTRLLLHGVNGSIQISPTDDIAATIAGERKVQSASDADANAFLEYLKVIVEDLGDEVYVHTEQPENSNGRILTVSYIVQIPSTWHTTISNINGGLQIDSLTGDINASITNGSIILNDVNCNVDLQLVNGTISGQLVIPDQGMCEMDVTNGTISLNIPTNTNAVLDAHVVNGSVNVINLSMTNISSSSTSFNGTIGTGVAAVNLAGVNGEINVAGY